MMRFGVCCGYRDVPKVAAAGFDYVEFCLSDLVKMDEAEFAAAKRTLEASGLQAESYNGFFFGGIKLLGDEANREEIIAHAEKGLSRAAQLGGKVAVLGSGAARRVPEGMTAAEGWQQFKEVAALCGDIAAKYGMVVAIEPLNAGETNQITTVAEGLRFCRELGHPAVTLLADYFHIYKSGETLDAVKEAGALLTHTHIARANDDRGCPNPEDAAMCAPFFAALKENGYTGRMSIEGGYKDFDQQIKDILPCFRNWAE